MFTVLLVNYSTFVFIYPYEPVYRHFYDAYFLNKAFFFSLKAVSDSFMCILFQYA